MKLYEYQSKAYFADFGIPLPPYHSIETAQAAKEATYALGGHVVLKAQVLVSGRRRAGGIRYAHNAEEAYHHAQELLGSSIYGHKVTKVLVDKIVDIDKRLYLAITNDRVSGRPVLMASTHGGSHIEDVALEDPETMKWEYIDPLIGLRPFQIRRLTSNLNLPRDLWRSFKHIIEGLHQCYIACDATLVEINPLVISTNNQLIAVNGKLNIDDNALFRQPELATLWNTNVEHPAEAAAREAGLTYIRLEGQIGCMVNGAGMAMTVMDMIQSFGKGHVSPANFLDIGGGATTERIITALEIILSDRNVQTVLINIFGGITHCDDVARGIVIASQKLQSSVPLVIRLEGTNAELAHHILSTSNLSHLIIGDTLVNTVQQAIIAAEGYMRV